MTSSEHEASGEGYERIDQYDPARIDEISGHYRPILEAIGEDPTREGLLKTPERVAKALQYLTHGYDLDPAAILRSAMFTEAYSQMVVVKDIEVYSMCEHHMLPFFGKAHVAYIPNGRIVGLSKIPRVVDAYARRLASAGTPHQRDPRLHPQTPEPLGVAVVIECSHLCMQMRGIQKQNSVTTTSAFTGIFLSDQRTRGIHQTDQRAPCIDHCRACRWNCIEYNPIELQDRSLTQGDDAPQLVRFYHRYSYRLPSMEQHLPAEPYLPGTEDVSSVRTFLASVFSYMALALVLSGVMAWWFGHSPDIDGETLHHRPGRGTAKLTILGWVVMLAPLGLVFADGRLGEPPQRHSAARHSSWILHRHGHQPFSFIFLIYTESLHRQRVLHHCGGVRAVMAVAGYTTKTDLTKLGSILMIGLIGIVDRVVGQYVHRKQRYHGLHHEHHRGGGLHRPYRLRCAEAQAHGRDGGHVATETAQKMALMGRSPLPGLHQPVPDAAAPCWRA
jgi:GTP cyclohydrolase I